MKSQAITEYGAALETVESETPQPSGSEVLVEITHCGVCHSDVHFHDGHFDMGGGNQLDVRARGKHHSRWAMRLKALSPPLATM